MHGKCDLEDKLGIHHFIFKADFALLTIVNIRKVALGMIVESINQSDRAVSIDMGQA